MKYEDPVKELNNQKYLNDVAMKSRYDMLYIIKAHTNEKYALSQKKCYRNYPSPCRDKDLLDFKIKATHQSLNSYLNHNMVVNDNIDNSNIFNTLASIDQTSTIRFRLNSTLKDKSSFIPTELSTISNRNMKKHFQGKIKLTKKSKPIMLEPMKFKKNILLPKIGRSLYIQPSRGIKGLAKCVFPKEKNTPILCTEFSIDDAFDNNNNEKKANTLYNEGSLLLTTKEQAEIERDIGEKTINKFLRHNKGEKKTILLSSLLKKNELKMKDVKQKEKNNINLDYIKENRANSFTQPTIQSTLTDQNELSLKKHGKRFDYYDNFERNNDYNNPRFSKQHIVLNYVYKKNHNNIRNVEKTIEKIQKKVADTFTLMQNNVGTIITDPDNLKDFY